MTDPQEQLIALYMVQVSDYDRMMLRDQFRTMLQATYIDSPRRSAISVPVPSRTATRCNSPGT